MGKCFCPTRLTECQAKPCPWPDIRQAYRKKLFAGLKYTNVCFFAFLLKSFSVDKCLKKPFKNKVPTSDLDGKGFNRRQHPANFAAYFPNHHRLLFLHQISFSGSYLYLMPECRKCFFRASRFQHFPGRVPPHP